MRNHTSSQKKFSLSLHIYNKLTETFLIECKNNSGCSEVLRLAKLSVKANDLRLKKKCNCL